MAPDRGSAQPSLGSVRAAAGAGIDVWRAKAARRRAMRLTLRHLVLVAASIPFLVPFYWLITCAFETKAQLQTLPPTWWPNPWTLTNFSTAVSLDLFWTYVANTAYITIFVVLATVASCAIIAYPFARLNFVGREPLFYLVLLLQILPPWTQIIPLYQIFRAIGWLGTLNPLTIPALGGAPFFIFLLRQFMMGIPFELSDAARIDGCTHFGIFWRVIVPLTKPALAMTAVFSFLWTYNDFFGPLIFLPNPDNATLALGTYQFVLNHGIVDQGAEMAYSVILSVPCILLFFFAQRTLIRGTTLSGLKF